MQAPTTSPLVSVLMTVYNGMPYLQQSVQAIQAQTYTNWELIIVDDYSTDTTWDWLSQLNDNRIFIFRTNQKGRGFALNTGLEKCKGTYLAINDADDVSVPNRLSKQVNYLNQHPEIALVGSNFVKVFSDFKQEVSHKPSDDGSLRLQLAEQSCIQHSTVMLRTNALKQINGYNTRIRFMFDRDMYIRLAHLYPIANMPDVLVSINRHQQQYFVSTYKGLQRLGYQLKFAWRAIYLLDLPFILYGKLTLRLVNGFLLRTLRNIVKRSPKQTHSN